MSQDDLRLHDFLGTSLDLFWSTNVDSYMAEPLWWAYLVRAFSQIRLPSADNPTGGLAVISNLDSYNAQAFWDSDGNRHLESFLALAGFAIVEIVLSRLEHNSRSLILARQHDSKWLSDQHEAVLGAMK